MKLLIGILGVFTLLALSSDVVFQQSWGAVSPVKGGRTTSCCDDFLVDQDCEITSFKFYVVWSVAAPEKYTVKIMQDVDGDPNNATDVYLEEDISITTRDTGDIFEGSSGTKYSVWEISGEFVEPVNIKGGNTYWFAYKLNPKDTVRDFYLMSDPVFGGCFHCGNGKFAAWKPTSAYAGFSNKEMDSFFELSGNKLSLDNLTWGNIKSSF